ncbi:VOC family protein [Rhizobium sp. RU36D]|uniref:VOC family protein n=1 Tax=Rhizobium sp. RU36D TaxID=1907415 RepID=UPI0009D8369E|nr:VOC family protein [Rhizobium sp. RU36D]SMC96583.1 hypothetical protein SAMN05880593_11279 [Rhizobium sp. RU36D]
MHGSFIWYELVTPDPAAAVEFYGKVVGWESRDSGMPGDFKYTIVQVPGYPMGVGGVMELTPEMAAGGVPPNWASYVAVDDTDAMVAAFVAEGGVSCIPIKDIPGVGRFAVVADPQGAVINLLSPFPPEGGMPPEPPANAPGTFGWRELMTTNSAAAFDFYSRMFGWQKDMSVDMGSMGVYQTVKLGDTMIAGMMDKLPEMPRSFWGYYINVEAAQAGLERVKAAGGQVLEGPMEVPGPSWIVQCIDPQGAHFALVAPKV